MVDCLFLLLAQSLGLDKEILKVFDYLLLRYTQTLE